MKSSVKALVAASFAVTCSFAQSATENFNHAGATSIPAGSPFVELEGELLGGNVDGFLILNSVNPSASFTFTVNPGGTGLTYSFAYLSANPQSNFSLTVAGPTSSQTTPLAHTGVSNANPSVLNASGAVNQGAGNYVFTINRHNGAIRLDDFTVTAVPEPEAYALALLGLGVVGLVARRRKQA